MALPSDGLRGLLGSKRPALRPAVEIECPAATRAARKA
eukprot:CAMPEP_0181190688 /NCGR_PEP_ID=MMETSP1096-20121128/12327_1 /TAXON_ID=156174 ORGANISM="Chrysochromulina ericina, Strain CCMP281" /NCGR_SAMPLE_ID=MMETSP1096 /ASSEMBLY_ACC=CAM_ASM_000453 /LENGTH=37 /DNA_ID= /DNA_START= /DNA_END= /DNA_ORIENTATION=